MSFWTALGTFAGTSGGAAAINLGGQVLGGLMGGSSGKNFEKDMIRQQIMEERRFKWLVQGAKNAGLNPLTVLGATGGQQASAPSPISASAVVGDSIAKWAANYDPIRDERQKLENELLQLQIDDIKATDKKIGVRSAAVIDSPVSEMYDPQDDNMFTVATGDTTLPVVDPGNTRPEMTRVNEGSYKGRYVVGINGKYYVTPFGTSPTEIQEAINGNVGSELAGLLATIQSAGNRVYVNQKGEFVSTKPKSRPVVGQPGWSRTPSPFAPPPNVTTAPPVNLSGRNRRRRSN